MFYLIFENISTNVNNVISFPLLYWTLVTSCIIGPFLCCHLLYLIIYLVKRSFLIFRSDPSTAVQEHPLLKFANNLMRLYILFKGMVSIISSDFMFAVSLSRCSAVSLSRDTVYCIAIGRTTDYTDYT